MVVVVADRLARWDEAVTVGAADAPPQRGTHLMVQQQALNLSEPYAFKLIAHGFKPRFARLSSDRYCKIAAATS